MRKLFLTGTAIATSFAATGVAIASSEAANAADTAAPAVSQANGKISAGAGAMNDDFSAIGEGSFSLPIGRDWGLQLDGAVATLEDDVFANTAAHMFWRDPGRGLVGAYGGAVYYDSPVGDVWAGQLGFEGEAYLGRFTLHGIVGGEFGRKVDDSVFGLAEAAFYPLDDLRVSAGYARAAKIDFGTAAVEYQVASVAPGFTTFVEGRYGEDENWGAWAGIRFYFGEPKSLIRRHREDDPASNAGNTFFAYGSAFVDTDRPPSQPPCDDPEGYCTIT